MRFRLIEKDVGGMANVGLDDQHMQGKEDDVTTSDSKTYIGSNGKQKLAMNKIKNTKIGDDIHYYINGQEGRGIVIKMANEYIEIFKEDGQLGTIHINDTFFVKDILINKQWDDMDDTERYEALIKIHAPSPRYITKTWFDMPEEIKELLRKEGGNMAGGTGSTYEEGETKDSETQDHARTGFAQNAQYAETNKVNYKPRWKDPETDKEDFSEESYRYDRESETEKHKEHMQAEEHIGHPDYFKKDKNPFWNKRVATDPNKLDSKGVPYGKGHHKTYHPDDPVSDHTRSKKDKKGKSYSDNYVRAGHEAKLRASRQNRQNIHTGESDWENTYQKYKTRRSGYDKAKKVVSDAEDTHQKNLKEQWVKDHPEPKNSTPSDSCPSCGMSHPGLVHESKPADDDDDWENPMASQKSLYKSWLESIVEKAKKHVPQPKVPESRLRGDDRKSPVFEMSEEQRKEQEEKEKNETKKSRAFGKLKPVYEGDTKEAKETKKAYEVWLERREGYVTKIQLQYEEDTRDSGKIDVEPDPDNPGKMRRKRKKKKETKDKSDVEHGRYGSVGGAPDVAVSTDTKVDVTTGTGYEERPHISVEEAGKLPRGTFNESGSELTVSGSQDSKDEPKFSQPHSQEQPIRKAGLPEQHPNTYGVRYGMKGGVKKVWCPEHQMWEETTKDWHEEK